MRTLFAIVFAAAIFALSAGASAGFPPMNCKLNEDGSSVLISASGFEEGAKNCIYRCKYTITGKRSFFPFNCQYALARNAPEKVYCEKKGEGPGYFSGIAERKVICVPR